MSALEKRDEVVSIKMQDLSPDYAEIMVIGKVLHASGYFKDVRDQAQAVAKILYGRELGFSPIVSMSGIHIIEGKPALSSNLLAAMIKRSGKYDYRVVRWDDTECVLMFRQKVDGMWEEVGVSSFSMDDAKRAKVIREGSGWTKFPKAMLFARALSQGERTYCPDVSACALYVPEELGATVNEAGEVTELPKSARPVAVTTHDIEIAGPALSSVEPQGKGATKASEKHGGQSVVASSTSKTEAEASSPSAPAVEYSTREQQDFMRLRFKDSLPPKYQANADELRREWLKKEGFVDEKGVGTSTKIPRDREIFNAVHKKLMAHAKTIAELAAK